MRTLRLFEAFGIEVETMIVNADDLSVLPACDRLLQAAGDRGGSGDVLRDETAWSNELVLHVVELKTNGPRPSLDGLASAFAADVTAIEGFLEPLGGRLLPTAMHPLMNPYRETRLWPHGTSEVYALYDRIFGCKGHGWANLQSVHVNLPFDGDEEFGRLHAAIRLVLPILPALAASSPIVEGERTGILDNRLAVYRKNQRLLPTITGSVVPERAFTRAAYEDRILRPIAREVARFDPGELLEPEWVNSRGAIARFVRNSVEIRVIDAQECSAADVLVAAAAVAVVRALTEERWVSSAEQREWHESQLEPLFTDAVTVGGDTVIRNHSLLHCFGVTRGPLTVRDLWEYLITELDVKVDGARGPLDVILRQGSLSERILRAMGPPAANDDGAAGRNHRPSAERIREVYGALADCLRHNRPFEP